MRVTNIEEYAYGIAQMSNWKSTITIRPSYKLKPHTSDRLMQRLAERLRVQVFYTMERDRNDSMYHLHLLLNKHIANQQVCKATGLNPKAVKYNEPIRKPQITSYIIKNINRENSHHNLF